MLSRSDLPGCTSVTETQSGPHRSLIQITSRLIAKGISPRSWISGVLGLALPLALMGDGLPSSSIAPSVQNAPAATYAMTTMVGAYLGDSALGDDLFASDDSMFSNALDFGAPVEAQAVATVAVDVANLRSGPGLDYDRLGTLQSGVSLRLLARSGDWFSVRTATGAEGWVSQDLLAVDPAVAGSVVIAKNTPAKPLALEGTTTDSAVNLRTGPGTHYSVVAKLPSGVTLGLLGRNGNWYQVQTRAGSTGWVIGDFLRIASSVVARVPATMHAASLSAQPAATTGASRAYLRQGPGTAFDALGKLGARSQLTLIARHGDWFKVQTAKGTVGWVQGDLVDASSATVQRVPVTNNVPAAPKQSVARASQVEVVQPGSGRGAVAARVALRHVGARYIWGGASPRGFDCSGLVQYAYRQAGLSLPHKASAMFSTRYGARVRSIGALRAGDIVFFANTAGRGITHVALYVGGGAMVTANSPRSGVRYASINTRYWRAHFAGAIRP
jgi:cell wall-associated NlpC family hydrolase